MAAFPQRLTKRLAKLLPQVLLRLLKLLPLRKSKRGS